MSFFPNLFSILFKAWPRHRQNLLPSTHANLREASFNLKRKVTALFNWSPVQPYHEFPEGEFSIVVSVHFCEDLVHVKVMVAEVFHHQFKLPSVQCTAVIGVECFEIFVRHTDALKLGAIVQSLEPFPASKPILEFFIRDPLVAVFVQEEKVNF